MTLTQLRNKANPFLLSLWDKLVVRQEAYHSKNGKYFQLIATAPVVDGVDTVLTVTHPSDERHQADVQFSFDSPYPFQVTVDEWGDKTETGFMMLVTIELPDGRKFNRYRTQRKNRSSGETSLFTSDWQEIIQ